MVVRWLPIRYRDSSGVPRLVVCDAGDQLPLFDCPLDNALDGYPPDYMVYELPASARETSVRGWEDLSRQGRLLGRIPISEVTVDASRRSAILETSIQRFLVA